MDNNEPINDSAKQDSQPDGKPVFADPAEHKSGQGVSRHPKAKLVLVLIFVLLLGVIAGLSYLLSQSNNDTNNNEAVVTQSEDVSDQQNVVTVNSELLEYSDDRGIRFAYPATWGEFVVVQGSETDHLINGFEYSISFDGNQNVVAGYRSSDWEHDPNLGHDGLVSPGVINFAEHRDNVNSYLDQSNVYRDSDGEYAYVQICAEFCTLDHPKTSLSYHVELPMIDNIDAVGFLVYGDVFGYDYTTKDSGYWDFDKIQNADATEFFKDTDSRYLEIVNIAESIKIFNQ